MKHDGLFSKLTWWYDVNLEEAVKEAKLRARSRDARD
jgi:hypothetical protein